MAVAITTTTANRSHVEALSGFVSMRTSIALRHQSPASRTGANHVGRLLLGRGVWLFVDAKFPHVLAERAEEENDPSVARVWHALDERTFARGATSRQAWCSGSVAHVSEIGNGLAATSLLCRTHAQHSRLCPWNRLAYGHRAPSRSTFTPGSVPRPLPAVPTPKRAHGRQPPDRPFPDPQTRASRCAATARAGQAKQHTATFGNRHSVGCLIMRGYG